jgi:flagellar biosynthesis protein FlhG
MTTDTHAAPPLTVYAFTSGKGGVGKTNIVANLGIAMAEAGRRVLIIDADLGLGNMDVIMGLRPAHTMEDVLLGQCSLAEALSVGPRGVKILAADSGVRDFTLLSTGEKIRLFALFRDIEDEAETILIDTSSGISSNVRFFASFAHRVVLITTPEPTAITDAYATMKILSRTNGEQDFRLLVNLAESEGQALEVFQTLRRAAERFLRLKPGYLGHILKDPRLTRSVRLQKPVLVLHPESKAGANLRDLAGRLLAEPGVCGTQGKGGLRGAGGLSPVGKG